jgi:hypothetical protein
MTKEEAKREFRKLIARYGIKWTAAVPAEAYERLRLCNQVLTEQDRRDALAEEVRR